MQEFSSSACWVLGFSVFEYCTVPLSAAVTWGGQLVICIAELQEIVKLVHFQL